MFVESTRCVLGTTTSNSSLSPLSTLLFNRKCFPQGCWQWHRPKKTKRRRGPMSNAMAAVPDRLSTRFFDTSSRIEKLETFWLESYRSIHEGGKRTKKGRSCTAKPVPPEATHLLRGFSSTTRKCRMQCFELLLSRAFYLRDIGSFTVALPQAPQFKGRQTACNVFFTVAPSETPQRNLRCGVCCLWWYTPSSSTKCSCRNSFDTYHSVVAVKDRAEPTATCCEREPVVFTADVPGCVQ